MTRFVAALLIAAGGAVRAQVDPRTDGTEDLGPVRPSALLARAHRDGRAQREAGVRIIAAAGHRIRLQDHQQGGRPCT